MKKLPNNGHKLILIGVGLAILYWLAESIVIDHLVWGQEGLLNILFVPAESNEFFMRMEVVLTLLLFSVYAQQVVNKRSQAEEKLHQSEERFRSLVQHGSDIITVVDTEATFRYISPAVEKVLGYLPEKMVGESAFDYLHPGDLEEALAVFAKVSSEVGDHPPVELRVLCKDGSWRYLEHVFNNLLDDPSVRGIVVNQRDVTERKKAEQGLREANKRLNELVALKADFTRMVAHELDTPIAVIRGYAEMLTTDELAPAEQSRALAQIWAETEVLNTLIADMRAAATVERQDFAIELQRIPVSKLLDDAARFGATVPGNHPLAVDNAADDEQVWADPNRIGQVLRNLLSNAAKYSPKGTLIELRAKPEETPGRVRIEVVDRGAGVHPDDVPRIFEKFGRGRDRSGRKRTGSGLGLYVSRRILWAHGNDLTLDPAPEGGSTFSFELEVAR